MTVTFTLSSLYTGATYVAGPFNIFAVTNTGASTQVGTGITKAQLATGHTISGISDATTGGTVNSTGTCTNSYPWYVAPAPTPTATVTELNNVTAVYGNIIDRACGNTPGGTSSTIYFSAAGWDLIQVGDQIYSNNDLDPVLNGYYYNNLFPYLTLHVVSQLVVAITDCNGNQP